LWGTTNWLHAIDYSVVALLGICTLLLTKVLDWDDLMNERAAWDVFIWYGGMVRMAEALGETGITKKFAEVSASFTQGWQWGAALAALALIYFYAHYSFASITAHASAMFIPFLFLEPQRRTHTLRHDAGAHLFRHGLCETTNVVEVRIDRVCAKHHRLVNAWVAVVEDSRLVVVVYREAFFRRARCSVSSCVSLA
jgi:hypothetical protein